MIAFSMRFMRAPLPNKKTARETPRFSMLHGRFLCSIALRETVPYSTHTLFPSETTVRSPLRALYTCAPISRSI